MPLWAIAVFTHACNATCCIACPRKIFLVAPELKEIFKEIAFPKYRNHPIINAITVNMEKLGQVDSPKSLETPEFKKMTQNFTKVTKYLTKLKDILINYIWEKYHVKKR